MGTIYLTVDFIFKDLNIKNNKIITLPADNFKNQSSNVSFATSWPYNYLRHAFIDRDYCDIVILNILDNISAKKIFDYYNNHNVEYYVVLPDDNFPQLSQVSVSFVKPLLQNIPKSKIKYIKKLEDFEKILNLQN